MKTNPVVLMTILSSTTILSLLILSALSVPFFCLAVLALLSVAALILLFFLWREKHCPTWVKGYSLPFMQPSSDDSARMGRLYERVSKYMTEKKPYLHDKFTITDLSRAVYSNKTYLSRTISIYSGRNFNQFVNGYRIKHAVELIEKNPRFSVMELASLCGFHSVVTFNSAFALNMNETPGSYMRGVKSPKNKKKS